MSVPRVLAVDWSGALTGERRKIWLAEARGGRLLRLECGRDREELVEHLIAERERDPALVVGLDFSFSLPHWFLEERGLASAPELWALVEDEGEIWLDACEPPFWGRPGTTRPELPAGRSALRRTEAELFAVAGIRPKSTFQIQGAGSVGTGSLRGMPVLPQLQAAGFGVWPFDAPALPLVVEIWPRLLTGPVNKSSGDERATYLREHLGNQPSEFFQLAAGSEDAFDAALSALVMSLRADALTSLPELSDPTSRLEGRIWAPDDPLALASEPEPEPEPE